MKKILSILLASCLMLNLCVTSFAADPNIDGGGGGMGDGTSTNYWNPGRDGVRVTVVRASDNVIMTVPIDFSDETNSDVQIHFWKTCKISYANGAGLSPTYGNYTSVRPATTMPTIVNSSGSTNIDAIRAYFCTEGTIRDISSITGFNYDVLISGDYKILLEPIAYFVYEGVWYAATATEAAKFNQSTSNGLRSKMASLTSKNLPLSMYLQRADLGFSAWTGGTSSNQADTDIISYLGLGIISFTEDPIEPDSSDVTYRANTEVITSVNLSTISERSPDNPAYVTFSVNGSTYTHSNIYLPEGGSQLGWFKWTTPAEAGTVTITISSNCTLNTNRIVAEIVDLDENEPPDPQANDRNDSYSTPTSPPTTSTTVMTWGEWDAWWYEYWVDNGSWRTRTTTSTDSEGNTTTTTTRYWVSNWEDEGWYVYDWIPYTASLSVSMNISPDSMSPTASSSSMKSGYGFNMEVSSSVRATSSISDYTGLQNVVAYFPEFEYEDFWRLLDRTTSGYSASFKFKTNQYSTYGQRVHFTPVWYPNGTYTAYATCLDAWTPAGMMSVNLTDNITISGSLFDDWHVRPVN